MVTDHPDDDAQSLLLFRVGGIVCAVPVQSVDSIVMPNQLTPLPKQSPEYVGVFQYRDHAVSVLSLQKKFGASHPPAVDEGRFVMADVNETIVGFWVDSILEIIDREDFEWGDAPQFCHDNIFPRTLIWQDKIVLYSDFEKLLEMKDSAALQSWLVEHSPENKESPGRFIEQDDSQAALARNNDRQQEKSIAVTMDAVHVDIDSGQPQSAEVDSIVELTSFHQSDSMTVVGSEVIEQMTVHSRNSFVLADDSFVPNQDAPEGESENPSQLEQNTLEPLDSKSIESSWDGISDTPAELPEIIVDDRELLEKADTVAPAPKDEAEIRPVSVSPVIPRPANPAKSNRAPFPKLMFLSLTLLLLSLLTQAGFMIAEGLEAQRNHEAGSLQLLTERQVMKPVIAPPAATAPPDHETMTMLPNPNWGVHTVIRGDTLWDLSAYYLNDPFRYPDLARWSKIQNPDLIYPDDKVIYQAIPSSQNVKPF